MNRLVRLAAVGVVTVMVAAACSSDSGSSDGPGNDADRVNAAEVFGEVDPAEGDPFRVGFAVDAGGEAVDTVETQIAAAATEDYVNEYLGGIGGHPLELVFCETRNEAATATACVNSFVQDQVSVVMVAVSGNGESLATAAAEAGIPFVTLQGNSIVELANPNSFSLTGNAVGVLGAPGVVMEEVGATDLAILTIDVPAAIQAVDGLARPAYEAAGINLDLITVAPGTPDMSAAVATGRDAEQWLVLGDAAFCTTALQGLGVQVPDAPVLLTQQCVAPDAAGSLPNGYEGVVTVGATRLDPDDPEFTLFEAVLDTFSDEDLSAAAPGFLADGFSTVLGFARLMDGYDGDGSPETVAAHLSTATGELPLGGGILMDCGNPPMALLTSVCSLGAWLSELDAAGDALNFEEIDVAPFFAS